MTLLVSDLMFRPRSIKSYLASFQRQWNLPFESPICSLGGVCEAGGSISRDRRRRVRVDRIVRRHSSYFNSIYKIRYAWQLNNRLWSRNIMHIIMAILWTVFVFLSPVLVILILKLVDSQSSESERYYLCESIKYDKVAPLNKTSYRRDGRSFRMF